MYGLMAESYLSDSGHRHQHLLNQSTINYKDNDNNNNDNTGNYESESICNEQKLVSLSDRTGYQLLQENGQRKYGPPPGWLGPPPEKGCEIFIGKIPRDCFEDELVPVFAKIGTIYELRLMMDFSGTNRGYAFVMYTRMDDARTAIRQLDSFEIRPGKRLGVVKSVDNCRLFVGGIPKHATREQVLDEMSNVTEGVADVILYSSPCDQNKNRGFAFVEYESHRAAAMARRKLIPGRTLLWNQQLMVDWAEPEPEVDDDTMSKVKVLYVRNVAETTTEEDLRDFFWKMNCTGLIKVKKLRGFAFVHFSTRAEAEAAICLNGSRLDGVNLEVTWAKPPSLSSNIVNRGRMPIIPSSTGQRFMVPVAATSTSLQSPSMINYSGFQHGLANGYNSRNRNYFASSSINASAGVHNLYGCNNHQQRYPQFRYYGALPGCMQLIIPTNVISAVMLHHPTPPPPLSSFNLPSSMSSTQLLTELCRQHGLSEPVYELTSMSTSSNSLNGTGSGPNKDDIGQQTDADLQQFYLYKVSIPNLGHFQTPMKYFRSSAEAKQHAAQCAFESLEHILYNTNKSPERIFVPELGRTDNQSDQPGPSGTSSPLMNNRKSISASTSSSSSLSSPSTQSSKALMPGYIQVPLRCHVVPPITPPSPMMLTTAKQDVNNYGHGVFNPGAMTINYRHHHHHHHRTSPISVSSVISPAGLGSIVDYDGMASGGGAIAMSAIPQGMIYYPNSYGSGSGLIYPSPASTCE